MLEREPNRERRETHFIYKFLGVSGSLVGTLALVNMLRAQFSSVDQAKALAHEIADVKASVNSFEAHTLEHMTQDKLELRTDNQAILNEITHRLERGFDKMSEKLHDSESRVSKNTDFLQQQITDQQRQIRELYALKLKSKASY